MSWSGLGWKEGISIIQLQKVKELERSLNKATPIILEIQLNEGVFQTLHGRTFPMITRTYLFHIHSTKKLHLKTVTLPKIHG